MCNGLEVDPEMLAISEIHVVTPRSLAEALDLLAAPDARPLAGATDATVRMKEGQWRPAVWVNIARLPELRGVLAVSGRLRIGAAEPYGVLLRHSTLQAGAPLLLQAIRQIGSVQIRATGSIGGNLGTASPAGDALPPLHALEATIHLIGKQGERAMNINEFILGPGKTQLQPGELITAVSFAAQRPQELSYWHKLGLRGAQAISLVNLALRLQPGEAPRTVHKAWVAFGAVGPTILRARMCEQMLVHAGPLDAAKARGIAQMAWKEVLPITDLRASAEYRQAMAVALLRQGLVSLFGSDLAGA